PLTTQRRYAPRHFPRDRSTHQAVFLLLRRPPPSTLFPYTTLFRSGTRRCSEQADARVGDVELGHIGAAKTVYFILAVVAWVGHGDRKSTRLNSSHRTISYAVFCLKKKKLRSSSLRVGDAMLSSLAR